MQCMVNNKKLHFGDEFPSCSDAAMTEHYYMQIQVLMKKLKIKNWTNCIQNRNNWKLCVEKAKTLKV